MFPDKTQKHRAMLAAIIDSSEDAIISKTLDGIITSWNKAAERMFGHTSDEAVGQHIYLLIPEDRRDEENMIIANLKQGKRIEHFETIRKTKSGQLLDISLTISPIIDDDGQIIGASKIARDISQQKELALLNGQYMKRLEVLTDIYKAVAEDSNVESILKKITDATTAITGAAFGAFFYNKTDVAGEAYMLYALSGAPREVFEKFGMPRNTAVFSKTFNGRGVVRSDDITKDAHYGKNAPYQGMPEGHLPVTSYLAVPVVAPNKVVIGGLFFGHPLPAMFKADHEIIVEAIAAHAAIVLEKAKLYEELNVLNAKKDDFIGFASHELKTPVTTIKGYLQMALKSPGKSEAFLPKLVKPVDRLMGIIDELLDISKIHSGRLDLNYTPTGVHTLIGDAVETIRAIAPDHEVVVQLPAEDILLKIDPQKISQVLTNILTNAVKYSAENTTVTITAMQLGDQMQIAVRDEGVGIGALDLNNIFSRYYRTTKSRNKAPGLGLGLYIARELVESHGGKIWVESEEGKGSIFYIAFPINKP